MGSGMIQIGSNSFSERKRSSGGISAVIIGFLMFLAAFPLTWWNEGRYVHRAQTLDKGLGQVVSIDPSQVDRANEGQLIHFNGKLHASDRITDGLFGIRLNAARLKRTVEMFQWKETKSNSDSNNKVTYSYSPTWSSKLIDSSRFKRRESTYQNPTSMPYGSESIVAPSIGVGAFQLSQEHIANIGNFKTIPVNEGVYKSMPQDIRRHLKLNGGALQSGDFTAPQVGDVRVSFEASPLEPVGIVGKQSGVIIDQYQMENGSFALLETGTWTTEALFNKAGNDNLKTLWVFRALGFAMMWMGLMLFVSPITDLARYVPFLGAFFNGAIGMVAGLIAVSGFVLTMGIAWVFYRPMIGVPMIIFAGFLVFWLHAHRKGSAQPSRSQGVVMR